MKELRGKIKFPRFLCLAIAWQFYGKGSPLFGVSARFSSDALLIFVGRMSGGMFATWNEFGEGWNFRQAADNGC
jgi:hypothetical protein